MKTYNTITATAAAKQGYHSITTTYRADAYGMLDRVIRDMQTGGAYAADFVLVNTGMDGIEVWRHTRELSTLQADEISRAETKGLDVGRAGR
jgi:hypothetical protein